MFFTCTRTRTFSYKKQAHATVANEDFKPFETNLKVSDRQERKSPLIRVTNEQNIFRQRKGRRVCKRVSANLRPLSIYFAEI